MIDGTDLVFIRKCFTIILRDGSLIHIFAEDYTFNNEYKAYNFQIYGINVCILPFESVVDIKEV